MFLLDIIYKNKKRILNLSILMQNPINMRLCNPGTTKTLQTQIKRFLTLFFYNLVKIKALTNKTDFDFTPFISTLNPPKRNWALVI